MDEVAETVTDTTAELASDASETAESAVEAADDIIEDAEFTDLPKEADADPVSSDVTDPVPDGDDAPVEDDPSTADSTNEVSSESQPEEVQASSDDDPMPTDEDRVEAATDSDVPPELDQETVTDAEDLPPDLEEAAAVAAAEPAPERPSAFVAMLPLLLGGVIAGAIGFFAGRYYDEFNTPEVAGPTAEDNAAALSEQTARLDSIESTLGEVAARDIGGEISEAVAPVGVAVTDVSTRVDGLTGALSSLSERVETIALRPTATGIEADEFDDALGEFRTQLQSTIDQAQAEIDKARSEAETISEQAFAAEQSALVQSAWSQIETALESGAAYREPLDELQSVLEIPVPELLTAHADDGIPQLSALQQEFPTVARTALDASIRTSSDEGGAVDKFTSFLRVQAGVRSLAPREGDDPDAVLSRAEAALKSGDVSATLEEIKTLPEAGQAALTDWAGAAMTRLDVLGAASEFADTLQ